MTQRSWLSRLTVLLAMVVVASCGTTSVTDRTPTPSAASPADPSPTPYSSPSPIAAGSPLVPGPLPTPSGTPGPSHGSRIVVVWLENREASAVTPLSMPYLYGLSVQYGRAAQMFAVAHPSQPNYLAFWSGSTQGVRDDDVHSMDAPNLASQVTAAGLQWRVYAQDVPAGCFLGATYSGPTDGPGVAGTYVRKHEPAISFASVAGNPGECAKIQPLASFDAAAADVAFVVPNLCSDAHDCSLADGDTFLRGFLPEVFGSPEWPQTLLVVTFDEGTSDLGGGGNVFAMVARQGLSGVVSSVAHDHYGVLRTVEDVLGLPCLAHACAATSLSEFLP